MSCTIYNVLYKQRSLSLKPLTFNFLKDYTSLPYFSTYHIIICGLLNPFNVHVTLDLNDPKHIQEINPSLDSPRISGKIILVSGTVDDNNLSEDIM